MNLQRYNRRTHIVEYMIKLKAGNKDNDLEVWKWFTSILEYLGPDGMSSDESSMEGVETVYRVKRLPWRRDIAGYMDIIDGQRHKDSDIFSAWDSKSAEHPQGSAPIAAFFLRWGLVQWIESKSPRRSGCLGQRISMVQRDDAVMARRKPFHCRIAHREVAREDIRMRMNHMLTCPLCNDKFLGR